MKSDVANLLHVKNTETANGQHAGCGIVDLGLSQGSCGQSNECSLNMKITFVKIYKYILMKGGCGKLALC